MVFVFPKKDVLKLCKNIKGAFPNKTIWIYTGYKYEDGNLYEVYATEEMRGGTFYPAKHLLSVEDKLLFGTDVLVEE